MYRHVYDLPEDELADLVYLFDTPPAGIGGAVEEQLARAVREWHTGYPTSTLVLEWENGGEDVLLVHDRRHGWPHRSHRLTGWEATALRHLEHGRTAPALHRLLAGSVEVPTPDALGQWLDRGVSLGLLYRDDRTYVSLPTWHVPVRFAEGAVRAIECAVESVEPVAAPLGPLVSAEVSAEQREAVG
ncbi:hypothetical protein [Streptomyces lunaelactis]|uniref:hypothetical protein n=1 Tax=Streptomyces lunaelactis TaxID=1535768 RepID=UPI001584C9F3|nr:hypothetical protein [Streptomyces lunaelactis]NUK05024.1 hypothetical protein [Streptomyces lunaelactis]NUK17208.1 hypothetical protein [Streptomyces lunaelactis]